ncbi:hypothetical protein [Serratia sp. (in: enterobacteria)]|uniref:hypothetical protein n=1 Tax=Serratia sp. (in: enterobacteria) TaxID=616 RepID=UPI00398A189C
MKRPLCILIVIIILAWFILSCLFPLMFWTAFSFHLLTSPQHPDVMIFFYLGYLLRGGIFVLAIWALIAIIKPRKHARLLGAMALLGVFVMTVISQSLPITNGVVVAPVEYSNDAQRGGALIAQMILILWYWIIGLRFIFSKRAKNWFAQHK